ncbi:FtsX-like permease family protein [Candidatus Poribacteria bacterium]|nr:FtsX-like permease family protein [Candidatus Poribacteria bacterium]
MKLYEGISTGLASIFQEKLRSALTMLGIVIGVAAVLAMLAIGEGAKRIVTQEFEKFGGHFFVRRNPWIWRGDRVFPNRSGEHLKYEDVLAIEAECPAVESVIPSISNEVLAQTEGGATKWTEYNGVNSYFPIGMAWEIQQGRFFSEDEFNNRRKVCVLGLEVATELFGDQPPMGTEIKLSLQGGRPDRFRILGVMAKRGTSLQYGFSWDDVVFIPLTTAQDRFKGKRHVNYLNVRAVDSDSIEKAAEEVTAVLKKRHRNQDNFFDISFATAAVKELDKISRIIKIMLSSIAGFSLFVGSVGIMNMMLVSVNQRTREIGIRRAIGAKRRDIFLQFLIEAIVMCGIGGLFGIGLGIGTGYVCSYIAVTIVKVIPQWPVVISPYWMVVSVSISAGIGILFGLYPAIRASHISPIEALRTQ